MDVTGFVSVMRLQDCLCRWWTWIIRHNELGSLCGCDVVFVVDVIVNIDRVFKSV